MPATHWVGGWMGPTVGLNDSQHLLTLPEIKHQFLSDPGHIQLLKYSGSQKFLNQ